MLNPRNEKGSITLFVLVSCMLFIASVVCVQMYMKSKQIAVDRQYRQIKSNYEVGLDNTTLDETYAKLAILNAIDVTINKASLSSNKIVVEFAVNSTEAEINEIKYGWGTCANDISTVSNWTYIENKGVQSTMRALKDNTSESGIYHLYFKINGKDIYKQITV